MRKFTAAIGDKAFEGVSHYGPGDGDALAPVEMRNAMCDEVRAIRARVEAIEATGAAAYRGWLAAHPDASAPEKKAARETLHRAPARLAREILDAADAEYRLAVADDGAEVK